MPACAGMTLRSIAPRPPPSEMPGAKEGHDERAETHEHPFEDDIRPFRRKLEQKREAHREIQEPQSTLTIGEDSPMPGGEANGVWNQAPLIP
jgi:hypothetical protein